jgi:hypothetical protein
MPEQLLKNPNNPKEDLETARIEVEGIFDKLFNRPEMRGEVAEYKLVEVGISNRPWLRNALLEEINRITDTQQRENLKYMWQVLPPKEEVRTRIGKLVNWCVGSSSEEPQYEKESQPYVPVYGGEHLQMMKSILYGNKDLIIGEEPEAVKSLDFQDDIRKIVQCLYLMCEAIKNQKEAEWRLDVTEEEMVADRIRVYACREALYAIFEKYLLPNGDTGNQYLFETTRKMSRIQDILRGKKEIKDGKAKEAEENAAILAKFDSATGGRVM